jgi:hypothetical protein
MDFSIAIGDDKKIGMSYLSHCNLNSSLHLQSALNEMKEQGLLSEPQ